MAEATGSQAEKKPTRAELVAWWSGRVLLLVAAVFFVVSLARLFEAALGARQYQWAFGSLVLFALFLFASRFTPIGLARRVELGLASARVLIDYEAPARADAIIEQFKAAIPAEARKAVEEAKPQLVKDVTREFAALSERAAFEAATTVSSATSASSGGLPGLNWSDFDQLSTELHSRTSEDMTRAIIARKAAIARRMGRRPTDPSSGSAR